MDRSGSVRTGRSDGRPAGGGRGRGGGKERKGKEAKGKERKGKEGKRREGKGEGKEGKREGRTVRPDLPTTGMPSQNFIKPLKTSKSVPTTPIFLLWYRVSSKERNTNSKGGKGVTTI
jgi:hypothetical protein